MNQNSSSQSQLQAAEKTRAIDKLSVIGEWLAPIIAWAVVIVLCLAITGFLLGEE